METAARTRSDAQRNTQRIIELLRAHPTGRISYDYIAAESDLDRRTVISIMCNLRHRGRVRVQPGRGSLPNCYQLEEGV